mgnify:CR=1 FL=1
MASDLDPEPDDRSRREREQHRRRREILAAAREVFAENGYVHATLDEIAERADFGKGTLYNYFPEGKEELLRAVLDNLFEDLLTHMEPLHHVPLDDEEAFRAAVHDYFRRSAYYFYQNQSLFYLLVREAWRLQLSVVENRRAYLRSQLNRSIEVLGDVVERAISSGAIRSLPVRTFAHFLLLGPVNYIASEEITGWPEDSDAAADEAAAFLTGLLMDGAKPHP